MGIVLSEIVRAPHIHEWGGGGSRGSAQTVQYFLLLLFFSLISVPGRLFFSLWEPSSPSPSAERDQDKKPRHAFKRKIEDSLGR